PRLGDLLDLVEVAPGTAPVADAAAKGCAGEKAAGDVIGLSGTQQGIDSLVETGASGVRIVARCCDLPFSANRVERQPEMGAPESQRGQSNVKQADRVFHLPFECSARPIAGGGVIALRQQQVAILITAERI